jgi:hypothetical protein
VKRNLNATTDAITNMFSRLEEVNGTIFDDLVDQVKKNIFSRTKNLLHLIVKVIIKTDVNFIINGIIELW